MLIIARGNPQLTGVNESPVLSCILLWSVHMESQDSNYPQYNLFILIVYLILKDIVEGQGWVDNWGLF